MAEGTTRDLYVRRVYTKAGISVVVEMDFVKKTVSFVDRDGKPKEWQFMKRTPEYMHGWIMIFEAMKYAAAEAKKEMDAISEKEHKKFVEMYMQIDQALKGKKCEN